MKFGVLDSLILNMQTIIHVFASELKMGIPDAQHCELAEQKEEETLTSIVEDHKMAKKENIAYNTCLACKHETIAIST